MEEIGLINTNKSQSNDARKFPSTYAQSMYYGLDQREFDQLYVQRPSSKKSCREFIQDAFTCSRQRSLAFLYRHVPLVDTLRTYRLRDYLLGDIVAGLSIGVMTVPQSLGYALIASVPAVVGLYTSIFPVLIYLVFATSRHVSIGSMALTSFLLSASVLREVTNSVTTPDISDATTGETSRTMSLQEVEAMEDKKILVATSISFLAGIILVVMGLCRLGFIVSYMSESFISGFLASANLRILTDQAALILGYKPVSRFLVKSWGIGEYLCLVYDLCAGLRGTVLMQLLISALTIVTLIVVKKCVNERFKHRLKIPIPIDVIVIALVTMASALGKLQEKFGVIILGDIRSGFPKPMLPSAHYMSSNLMSGFMVAIISFMLVAMMAQIFSERLGYPIDNNQELIANGLACVGGAFFRSIACSTSPPRCFLMESAGGHTQLTHLFSSLVVLVTLLWIAPLFYFLPRCVLGCVVIVAYVPLFFHYTMWLHYYRTDRYDFTIWMVSAVATLILPVDQGLIIGVFFSLIVVNYRMHRPRASTLVEPRSVTVVEGHRRDFVFVDSGLYETGEYSELHVGGVSSVRQGGDESDMLGQDKENTPSNKRHDLESSSSDRDKEVGKNSNGLDKGTDDLSNVGNHVTGHSVESSMIEHEDGLTVGMDAASGEEENRVDLMSGMDEDVHIQHVSEPLKSVPRLGTDFVVFRFESPLYFATLNVFKEKLYSKTVSLDDLKQAVRWCEEQRRDRERKERSSAGKGVKLWRRKGSQKISTVDVGRDEEMVGGDFAVSSSTTGALPKGSEKKMLGAIDGSTASLQRRAEGNTVDCTVTALADQPLSFIILDCSAMSFMDTGGAKLFAHLHKEYAGVGVRLLFCACNAELRTRLASVRACRDLTALSIYPTVQDAVVAVQCGRVSQSSARESKTV